MIIFVYFKPQVGLNDDKYTLSKTKIKFVFKDSIGSTIHTYITPYVHLDGSQDKTENFYVYVGSEKASAIRDVEVESRPF